MRRKQTEKKGLEQFNLDHQPQIDAAQPARAARLRAGGGSRLPPHGASEAGARKDQSAPPRHRGDDVRTHFHRRRRIRACGQARSSATTKRSCSATWWSWRRRKASTWSCWWFRRWIPSTPWSQTASRLQASRLVTGVSARMASEELARRIGLAWEKLPEPRHPFSLEVISPDRPSIFVNLGPHPPRLWPEDVDLLHDIWLKLERIGTARFAAAPSRCGRRGAAPAAQGSGEQRSRPGGRRSPTRTAPRLAARKFQNFKSATREDYGHQSRNQRLRPHRPKCGPRGLA